MRPNPSRPGQLAIGAAVAAAVIVAGGVHADAARRATDDFIPRDCADSVPWTSDAADHAPMPEMLRLAQSIEINSAKFIRENRT